MYYILIILIIILALTSVFWFLKAQEAKQILTDYMQRSEIVYDYCDEMENNCDTVMAYKLENPTGCAL